jgi:hypothetical protein
MYKPKLLVMESKKYAPDILGKKSPKYEEN